MTLMVKKINRNHGTIDFNDIYDEYLPDNSPLSNDSDRYNKIANIVFNNLDECERRILLLYAENPSLRKVGEILNCSQSLVNLTIKEIRKKIKQKYDALP